MSTARDQTKLGDNVTTQKVGKVAKLQKKLLTLQRFSNSLNSILNFPRFF